MLGSSLGSIECLQACEVLQQMCQLSDSMALSVLHEGALWRLSCLLMSFRDLLPSPPSDGSPRAAPGAQHGVPRPSSPMQRQRAPPTAAVAAARAGARACTVLLQRCSQARPSFVAMGGLHATMHLLRDLQVSLPIMHAPDLLLHAPTITPTAPDN